MKKAELITFLQNNLQPTPAPCIRPQAPLTKPQKPTRPPPPPPQMSTWEPIDDRLNSVRLRQPELLRHLGERQRQSSSQEINMFEQQKMSKSRSQVKNKLKDWYDWFVNHVPKPIKDKASRAFKALKDKIMGLYEKVKGEKT